MSKDPTMQRTTTILAATALAASLAFAPVTTAEEEAGATLELTAVGAGAGVEGTLAFSGAATIGSDAAADAQVSGVGLDVGDLRISQHPFFGLIFELDVLDPVQGEVAPTALYKVDVTGTLSLMAYRGPGIWDYQVADFSDGYTSTDANGSFDGSTITWRVPTATFGSAGTQFAPGYVSSQGLSPAGLASLQLSNYVQVDQGSPIALFEIGGRIDVTVKDDAGSTVDTAIAFADGGEWSYDGRALEPGTYTLIAETGYADLTAEVTTQFTVPEPTA